MLCRKRFPGSNSACAGRSDGCGFFCRDHAAGWNHGAAAVIVAVVAAASVAMIAITTAVAIAAAAAASIAAATIATIPAAAVVAAGVAIAAALDYLMNKNADSRIFQQLES